MARPTVCSARSRRFRNNKSTAPGVIAHHHARAQPSRRGSEPASSTPVAASRNIWRTLKRSLRHWRLSIMRIADALGYESQTSLAGGRLARGQWNRSHSWCPKRTATLFEPSVPPLGEEREYETSRQDRKIASSPDRSVARPRPTRSSTARQIGNTAEPDCRMICAEPRATLAVELLAQRSGRVIPFVCASAAPARPDRQNQRKSPASLRRLG